ncbi:hypothetical protein EMCRGX_G017777 [Ephydatia muelleri]
MEEGGEPSSIDPLVVKGIKRTIVDNLVDTRTDYYIMAYTQPAYTTVISYQCCAGFVGNPATSCLHIDECKENLSGCNQNCTNTNGSFSCSCYSSGYDLVNGNTCTDLNECSVDNGGCDHQCSNTVGSYTCKCNRGFRLRDDKHTCESVQCSEIQEPEHGNMICDGNEISSTDHGLEFDAKNSSVDCIAAKI